MIKKFSLSAFERFFQSKKAGGVLLLICVLISLLIANGSLKENFASFLAQKVGLTYLHIDLNYEIWTWINDGLMAVFFLYVGLEIKRELLEGELSSFQKSALPVLSAIGGMLIPACIYTIFNLNKETASGWGIPMATDIAFALAIIGLLGNRIPHSLKIFLAALAIVDDLGAILVIALFYTGQIHLNYLLMAGAVVVFLGVINLLRVKNIFFYLLPGLCLWYFIHHSGVHATVAGVLLAFCIPTNKAVNKISPLEKLEHSLNIPVNFFIMPIFALANTNITFTKDVIGDFFSPLTLGIIWGLLLGKPLGITIFSWLAIKLKIAKLPNKVKWSHILGAGMLAGIGFTMSIFIALLSFQNDIFIQEAKFAILSASVFSGLCGFVFLKKTALTVL